MNIEEIRKLNNEELVKEQETLIKSIMENRFKHKSCLLYTSDAADEGLGVDLGGRRIIKIGIFDVLSSLLSR